MDAICVYFSQDNELSEYEATSRGYRSDVYVFVDSSIYKIVVYNTTRLTQDFLSETENCGFFLPEPNIVLVKEANKGEILNLIRYLYEKQYFKLINPVANVSVKTLKLVARIPVRRVMDSDRPVLEKGSSESAGGGGVESE